VIGYGQRTYIVNMDFENEIYNCQYCKIKKDGILCCHVLKVMSYIGAVKRIPEQYILRRWSQPDPDVFPATTELPQHPLRRSCPGKICRCCCTGTYVTIFLG
jgi:hypothetical protein